MRNDIIGMCSGLGEVLAKWDDAHDMKRFARKFDVKLDSVNYARICSENVRRILHQYKTVQSTIYLTMGCGM